VIGTVQEIVLSIDYKP